MAALDGPQLQWAAGIVVEPKDKTRSEKSADLPEDLAQNASVDEFFERLNSNVRRPKPGDEAVAAVVEALQRLSVQSDVEEAVSSGPSVPGRETNAVLDHPNARVCSSCGSSNRLENKFCSTCGVSLPLDEGSSTQPASRAGISHNPESSHLPPGPHHYHHHYHHHYFAASDSSGGPASDQRPAGAAPARDAGRLRSPLGNPATAVMSRAETAARKTMQDWALACNTKQLDDLVELYLPDAIVLRPNVPQIRGAAPIREFFFSALGSGFGEVELEPLRVEMMGDIAYEAGRCKSLVPSAAGKRREDRGKYLIVLMRQPGGEWKIASDCWSSDLVLTPTAIEPEGVTAPPTSNSSANKTRRS